MFYDFIKWCLLMLYLLFVIEGVVEFMTNARLGNFCDKDDTYIAKWKKLAEEGKEKGELIPCMDFWVYIPSIANIVNQPKMLEWRDFFVYATSFITIIVLIFFRRK